MKEEIRPEDSSRFRAYQLWMKAPNPMVTLIRTFDVTDLWRTAKRKNRKKNALLVYCIAKAASSVPEFYTLPENGRLYRYDRLAVSVIVRTNRENQADEICFCDIPFSPDLDIFCADYDRLTAEAARTGRDHDCSKECMVIGTSAITETELDGAVNFYAGAYANPFLIWGKARQAWFRTRLAISFQFHHTQMDGAHAGRFLETFQNEICRVSSVS